MKGDEYVKRSVKGSRFLFSVAVATTAFLAVACAGSGKDAPNTGDDAGPPTSSAADGGGGDGNSGDDGSTTGGQSIGVVFATFDSPFFSVIEKEIHAGAQTAGLNPLPTLSSDFDVTKEATDIRNLITQDVDGLIINPSDSSAVVPSLAEAEKAGIPVVTFDALPDSGKVYISVRADNIAMGAMACESLAALVGEQGKVVEIQGDLAQTGGRERAKGFEDCMSDRYPNIEVLKVPAYWKAEEAASGLDAIMTANPDLAGIYIHTGGGYLAPVKQILQKNNRWIPSGQDGHIPFVSIDGEPSELEAIREGYLDSTVSQPANLYGEHAVKYMKMAIAGDTVTPGPTDHNSEIIEQPNGILEDVLPPTAVTKANVDDPELWGNAQ
jgi:ABC-type sugar transport system substrate-binding protein